MLRSRSRRLRATVLLMAVALPLAGCGTSAPHRMGTGTAGGAATGAAFGLIGGPIGVAVGAAIGGGIGALTASTTTPKQINLDNIGKTGPAASGGYGAAPAYSNNSGVSSQPGLRAQINQYQAQPAPAYGQPQSLSPQGYGGSGGAVQSQPLPPPNTQ